MISEKRTHLNLRSGIFSAVWLLMGMLWIIGAGSVLHGEKVVPEKKPVKKESAEKKDIEKKKSQILPYEEVITDEARSDEGLFTVHFVDEKLYFEIPKPMLDREMLLVSRLARAAANLGYGGQKTSNMVLRWQSLKKKILLRVVSHINVADKNLPIYQAVRNANFEPIVYTFDIKAYSKDKTGVVIEATDLLSSDIPFLGLPKSRRELYKIKGLEKNKSMIVSVKSFPRNIEMRNILTYSATEPPSNSSAGTISVEMNHSMILLPEKPMRPRNWDERVGYFRVEQTDYGSDSHRAVKRSYITRRRLEPKDPQAFARGELSEPVKPIVYFLDPATPRKWRRYIKQGVEDWNVAFEAAGFKNAVVAKDPPSPEEDPEFSPEDVRYSVIRYFPSEIMNAFGPHVHDPRSGEIIESDIGLYHNVLNLLRNWYFTQTAAANPEARGIDFKDEVMGRLLRYVVCHEVGHTLGFPHNMKASSTFPVEKLRSPEFTRKMGTASSIMDYARFNYVAQPGDGVKHFVPIIGPYDIYAIRWGYRPIPEVSDSAGEKPILNRWIKEKYKDPVYHYGNFSSVDPTCLSEALSDDAVKAGEYGIANLKRILNNLLDWTYQEGEDYSQLKELYGEIFGQFNLFTGHVVPIIGGVYRTYKTNDQAGGVYAPVSAKKQREAMAFLARQVFSSPTWMINWEVLDRIQHSGILERIRQVQTGVLKNVLEPDRMHRLIEAEVRLGESAYTLGELLLDLRKAVFGELEKTETLDTFRRNLQRAYLERLDFLMKPRAKPAVAATRRSGAVSNVLNVSQSDVQPLIRGELEVLKKEIAQVMSRAKDSTTVLHLRDLLVRIDEILRTDKTK